MDNMVHVLSISSINDKRDKNLFFLGGGTFFLSPHYRPPLPLIATLLVFQSNCHYCSSNAAYKDVSCMSCHWEGPVLLQIGVGFGAGGTPLPRFSRLNKSNTMDRMPNGKIPLGGTCGKAEASFRVPIIYSESGF